MSVLILEKAKKILGTAEILSGADLVVDNGEKVGIVGRNGEGKSTLLRLVAGTESVDVGTLKITRGARVGYVEQRPKFEPGVTVRQYVETGLEEVRRVEGELERSGEAMATADGEELEKLMRRHGELTARMEFLGGWEAERTVETVLGGIGLRPELWDREAQVLSGGEKSRTSLARELVAVPDLLLLDEPTNHLDLAGIEWLEAWLKEIRSAVILVSHDRRMLDSVVDVIVEVERGKLVRYPGNYSKYVDLKAERFTEALREYEAQQEFLRKEESFIKKHMGSQRTGEAKGRRKRLQSVERLERPYDDVRRPVIQLAKVERGGEEVLSTEGLTIGPTRDLPLLDGVDLRIGRGQRIGIVGPNGAGKSTLLKTLAGRIPALAGEIRTGYKAHCGYYDQELEDLRDDGTPFTEILRDHPRMTELEIRNHLAKFLFRGKDVDLSVGTLSGGERARLTLARLVLTEPSWLALDEPTNHLDLAGRTALEEMLSSFPGALVVITHDRTFLDGLATHILEVKPEGVRSMAGNYSDYRALVLSEQQATFEANAERKRKEEKAAKAEAAKAEAAATKANGKPKDAKPSGKQKKKPRNPWRLEKLESAIIELEGKREELLAEIAREDVYTDHEKLLDAQLRLSEVERDLEQKNEEWANWE